MGWKNLKEHFRIEHAVQVTPAGICIGSPYIHDLIVIDKDMKVIVRDSWGKDGVLARYLRDLRADPAKLRALIEAPDTFTAGLTVYTYDDGRIIEKQCEVLDWPNVTHDGEMMYQNTFSTDRNLTVVRAKRNADCCIESATSNLAEAEERLAKCRARLAEYQAHRAALEADFPDIPAVRPRGEG